MWGAGDMEGWADTKPENGSKAVRLRSPRLSSSARKVKNTIKNDFSGPRAVGSLKKPILGGGDEGGVGWGGEGVGAALGHIK